MDSFLNGIVSNTAFAGGLALIAFGAQKIGRSPQLAHALWLLVLIKLITPPVFHLPLPDRLGLSVRRVAERGSPRKADGSQTSLAAEGNPPLSTSSQKPGGLGDKATASVPSPGASAVPSLVDLLAGRWQVLLCVIWTGGVIVGVAILYRRLGQLHTLLSEADDGDAGLIDDVQAIAKRLGMRSFPSIRILDARFPPLVFAGWRSLCLLIPARLLKGLDREQLQSVLVHELAHIRRCDHLTRWFEVFVRGIFWWHPLVWWASRQLRQAEEECCDAWVVWALPDCRRSYGKALLWTIEFLAERRCLSVVAGTALGGTHVKRRIEMIVSQQLNRRMSWGAFAALILLSACVLPVAAQLRDDEVPPTSELPPTAKRPAADPGNGGQIDGDAPTDPRLTDPKSVPLDAHFAPGLPFSNADALRLPLGHAPETKEDRQLKETLVALDKQIWNAAGKGDGTVYETLLDDNYFGFYANSSGFAREAKATVIAAVKRRRYFDVQIRDEAAKRIGKDTAILTYIYSCKVEEAGRLQTYRDHQSTQVWTQQDSSWVLSFAQDFILPGGE